MNEGVPTKNMALNAFRAQGHVVLTYPATERAADVLRTLEIFVRGIERRHSYALQKVAEDPTRYIDRPCDNADTTMHVNEYIAGCKCLDVDPALPLAREVPGVVDFGRTDIANGRVCWALTPAQDGFRQALYRRLDRHFELMSKPCTCSLCLAFDEHDAKCLYLHEPDIKPKIATE